MKPLVIYDTTLRDGAQREGISLSVKDKLRIAQKMDELGVSYIEGGWPGSNPKDLEFFRQAARLSLSSARCALLEAPGAGGGRKRIKTRPCWRRGPPRNHLRQEFRFPGPGGHRGRLEENLKMIGETVAT